MTCRQCNWKMPDTWRRFVVGRHVFCGKDCGTKFALAEVPRLEAHLSHITKKTRGMGRDLAMQALYSNLDPV